METSLATEKGVKELNFYKEGDKTKYSKEEITSMQDVFKFKFKEHYLSKKHSADLLLDINILFDNDGNIYNYESQKYIYNEYYKITSGDIKTELRRTHVIFKIIKEIVNNNNGLDSIFTKNRPSFNFMKTFDNVLDHKLTLDKGEVYNLKFSFVSPSIILSNSNDNSMIGGIQNHRYFPANGSSGSSVCQVRLESMYFYNTGELIPRIYARNMFFTFMLTEQPTCCGMAIMCKNYGCYGKGYFYSIPIAKMICKESGFSMMSFTQVSNSKYKANREFRKLYDFHNRRSGNKISLYMTKIDKN